MPAKSTPQILPLNVEYTVLFLKFLIIGLCNSSANCWFCVIWFLIADLVDLFASEGDFLSKNLKTIEATSLWYPTYFGFLTVFNALSLKTLSEAALLVRSLKSP